MGEGYKVCTVVQYIPEEVPEKFKPSWILICAFDEVVDELVLGQPCYFNFGYSRGAGLESNASSALCHLYRARVDNIVSGWLGPSHSLHSLSACFIKSITSSFQSCDS